MMKTRWMAVLAGMVLSGAAQAQAQAQATFSIRAMTPETALKAAQAALKSCRGAGYQVAVAVVDRMGVTQVMLRDRFAGALQFVGNLRARGGCTHYQHATIL